MKHIRLGCAAAASELVDLVVRWSWQRCFGITILAFLTGHSVCARDFLLSPESWDIRYSSEMPKNPSQLVGGGLYFDFPGHGGWIGYLTQKHSAAIVGSSITMEARLTAIVGTIFGYRTERGNACSFPAHRRATCNSFFLPERVESNGYRMRVHLLCNSQVSELAQSCRCEQLVCRLHFPNPLTG